MTRKVYIVVVPPTYPMQHTKLVILSFLILLFGALAITGTRIHQLPIVGAVVLESPRTGGSLAILTVLIVVVVASLTYYVNSKKLGPA